MEIDPSPVPPPQEYSDNPAGVPYQSESSMNFDYLHSLHGGDSAMDSSNSGSSSARLQNANSPPRHFAGVGGGSNATSSSNYGGHVDDSRVVDRCLLQKQNSYNYTHLLVYLLDKTP